jgi:7-cyano-7-deazaguanine tRNA-ribosyltransferase
VERTRQRVIDRVAPPQGGAAVLVRAKGTPYTQRLPGALAKIRRRARVPLIFETVWGPVPEALDECYPFSQTVAPSALDAESASRVTRAVEAFARRHSSVKIVRFQESLLEEIERSFSGPPLTSDEQALAQVDATLRYQFGPEAAGLLAGGAFGVERSRTTNKIRRVFLQGRHALSLRAHDGLFTLTFEGGRRLHAALPSPRHRIAVFEDTAPFNAEGRSVFAKFVKFVDPELRPGEEVLVEDEGGALVAVGRMLLSARETTAFKQGVAVQVREGAKSARAVATAR